MNEPALGESAHDKAMIAKIDAAAAKFGGDPGPTPAAPAPAAPSPAPAPAAPAPAPAAPAPAAPAPQDPPKDPPKDPPADPPQDPPKDPPQDPPKDPAPAAPPKLNFAAMTAEYAEKGALSDESLKLLEAIGLDKATVENIAAGQIALQQLRDQKAMALVGGQQSFEAMRDWASTAFSEAEQAHFNKVVASGTEVELQTAMLALKSRYEAARGQQPALVNGAAGGAPAVGAYASRGEITAAMRDPRYQSDEAYRAEVARRLDLTDYSSLR